MRPFRSSLAALALASLGPAPGALGQANTPMVFVSNNGNLEGSVSAMRLNEDNTLTLVDRNITGSRASINDPCEGCNAYEIALNPSGSHLVLAHAAGVLDGISFHRVNADGTLDPAGMFPNTDSPIDIVWLTDDVIAVALAEFSPDLIRVYRYNPAVPSITLLDTETVGTSTSYLALSPARDYLYASDSGTGRLVRAFRVEADSTLTFVGSATSGTPFALEINCSADGRFLYGAGGISDGGNKVVGFSRDAMTGLLTALPGSPFLSQGASPSNLFPLGRGDILIVGHGTDATMRSMFIDPMTGALTATGFMFDVGLQGTLGDVSSINDLAFVTDNSTAIDGLTGIYSFKVSTAGEFIAQGPIVLTGGIAPRSIAVWQPPAPPACPGDADGDRTVGLGDAAEVILHWGETVPPAPAAADLDGSGDIGLGDMSEVILHWGDVCP